MNHSYSNLAKIILDRMEFYGLIPELLNNIYYAHLSGGFENRSVKQGQLPVKWALSGLQSS